jgi:uncharacterized protein (DUF2164 family)
MIKTDFKINLLILIISVMGFLSGFVGGYFYYSALKKDAIALANEKADESVKLIGEHIESYIHPLNGILIMTPPIIICLV